MVQSGIVEETDDQSWSRGVYLPQEDSLQTFLATYWYIHSTICFLTDVVARRKTLYVL